MKILIAVATVVLFGGATAYLYWQHIQPKPEVVQVKVSPPSPSALPQPAVRQVIEASPVQSPLPKLAESDSFMLDALARLVGNKSLMKFFHTERIIHNIVATIDNLPTQSASMRLIPVEQASGMFVTAGTEGDLAISPKNAVRYTPYVRIAEAINFKKLVELYVRLYPLFQQSYEELGYPKKYFNDRLIDVLDNLLAAPNIKEPIRLVQTHVLYLYADPDLEKRSIGQRILMRIGSNNEMKIKAKLKEIIESQHASPGKTPAAWCAPAQVTSAW